MQKYVVYTRVSTDEQGRSGLGLDAQQRDIELYLTNFSEVPYEVIGRLAEVMSGGSDDRPQLALALKMVRSTGAELLVAKLDRLSRKVSFISTLMDDKAVKLRVASMPRADKFQLHIYAALAEQERSFISERTKAALRAAQARAKAMGKPSRIGGLRDKTMKRNLAVQAKAKSEAERVMKVVGPLRRGGATLAAIAATLNEAGISTSRGGTWTATQVSRVIERTSA
jgi:DNA invertase Pin-like site-specific DNA recombinase